MRGEKKGTQQRRGKLCFEREQRRVFSSIESRLKRIKEGGLGAKTKVGRGTEKIENRSVKSGFVKEITWIGQKV